MKIKHSIERKMLISFILVVTVPIIVTGIVSYWFAFSSYKNQILFKGEQEVVQMISVYDRLIMMGMSADDALSELKVMKTNDSLKLIRNFEIAEEGWKIQASTYTSTDWKYEQAALDGTAFVLPLSVTLWTDELLEIQKYTIIVVMIAIIVAVQSIVLLSHHLSKPIRKLAEYCREIGLGKDTSLPTEYIEGREDEIQVLGDHLGEMVESLSYKQQYLERLKTFQEEILTSTFIGVYTKTFSDQTIYRNERWRNHCENSPELEQRMVEWLKKNSGLKVEPVQWTFQNHDKEQIFSIRQVPLISKENEVIGVLCTAENVTERVQIEKRMEVLNRLAALGELTAQISHEIRNPLTGMKTTAQVLKKRLNLKQEDDQLFCILEGEIDRLNNSLSKMLHFARPKQANRKMINVAEVILETVTMLKKTTEDRNIQIIIEANASIFANVDEDHLKQVLLNLLLNGIKAIEGEGQIQITVKNIEEKVEISIIDNGVGIEKEHLAKIFYPFFTTNTKGTGLGLAVVEQLLLQNEGEIQVESQVGYGTAVKISLEGNVQSEKASINN